MVRGSPRRVHQEANDLQVASSTPFISTIAHFVPASLWTIRSNTNSRHSSAINWNVGFNGAPSVDFDFNAKGNERDTSADVQQVSACTGVGERPAGRALLLTDERVAVH